MSSMTFLCSLCLFVAKIHFLTAQRTLRGLLNFTSRGDSSDMKSNSRFQRITIPVMVFSLMLTLAFSIGTRAQEKSLYERVGGYNALAAVVDDFIGRLVADKQFEKFFIGHSTDSKR